MATAISGVTVVGQSPLPPIIQVDRELERRIMADLVIDATKDVATWTHACQRAFLKAADPVGTASAPYGWIGLGGNLTWAATALRSAPVALVGGLLWGSAVSSAGIAAAADADDVDELNAQLDLIRAGAFRKFNSAADRLKKGVGPIAQAVYVNLIELVSAGDDHSPLTYEQPENSVRRRRATWEFLFKTPFENGSQGLTEASASAAQQVSGVAKDLAEQYTRQLAQSLEPFPDWLKEQPGYLAVLRKVRSLN